MNTQNLEVSSPQSSPVQNESTTLISSFLNANLASGLGELGIKECSKAAQEQIIGLRSLDDRVFITSDHDEFLNSLVCALASEVIEVTGRGHTLIIAPENLTTSAIKLFAKYDLELLNLSDSKAQITDPRHSVIGSASQIADFFRSDQGRATKIARVVILSIVSHEIDALKDALGEACKRGQRPQLALVEAEQSNIVTDLTRAFLRSTANLETHYFVQLQANGKHRSEALIEALESESLYPSLVFCKNNAEVTTVENSLRHRGIRCRKLVGKLPPHKAREIITDLKSGDARVLLATDGPSEQVELELFKFIINFSIPSEPESYIHRTESPLGPISSRKILSIITPLDRSNFDYIKRIVSARFEETSGPDSDVLLQRQLERIEADAIEKFGKCEDRIKDMAQRLSERSRSKELIGQLLYLLENRNSSVLRDSSRIRNEASSESEGDGDDRRKEKGGFRIGNRGQRDEKNSDRDSRDRDSRDRDNRDRDNRETREGGRSGEGWKRNEGNQHSRNSTPGNASRRERDNNVEESDYDRTGDDFGAKGQNDEYERQHPKFVVKKFSRMYLNKGSKAGITAEYLKQLKLGESEPVVINCSVRPHYTFVDVPEEFQERLTTELGSNPPGGIQDIAITKAITIASKERLKNDDEVVISEPEAELAS